MPSSGPALRRMLGLSALILACSLASLQAVTVIPPGTTTYQFVGQCYDCTGTGVGLLTLQDYTLGDDLDDSSFVSFSHVSSELPDFVITQSDLLTPNGLSGSLPLTFPAAADVNIEGTGRLMFRSYSGSGYWCIGDSCMADYGFTSSWNLAPTGLPELGSLACVATGVSWPWVWHGEGAVGGPELAGSPRRSTGPPLPPGRGSASV